MPTQHCAAQPAKMPERLNNIAQRYRNCETRLAPRQHYTTRPALDARDNATQRNRTIEIWLNARYYAAQLGARNTPQRPDNITQSKEACKKRLSAQTTLHGATVRKVCLAIAQRKRAQNMPECPGKITQRNRVQVTPERLDNIAQRNRACEIRMNAQPLHCAAGDLKRGCGPDPV